MGILLARETYFLIKVYYDLTLREKNCYCMSWIVLLGI